MAAARKTRGTSDSLERYRAKRDLDATPEPAGGDAQAASADGAPRFVVQEHHATRLHWDLRLEHDGALASWAVPNGIPQDPKENRLAVRTEDHPLEYLEFSGEIPKGQYGAGSMTIWDSGTYEPLKWEDRKVEVEFHGERLHGRYGLFPIGREDSSGDWLIHRMDPPDDPDRVPMPEHVVPMMARSSTALPPRQREWSFEVKWDGVRAIAYAQPGRLRLESRNLNDVTAGYPEVRGVLEDLGMHEAVLDGEIVAFDDGSGQAELRAPAAADARAVGELGSEARRERPGRVRDLRPALPRRPLADGASVQQRRARLEQLGLGGRAWRVPSARGGGGDAAARRDPRAGARGGRRQAPGLALRAGAALGRVAEGQEHDAPGASDRRLGAGGRAALRPDRRAVDGLPRSRDASFVYAGRVGTGFTEKTLDELARRLEPFRREGSPFAAGPRFPREAVFVEPNLVAEVEFREWTGEGVMRAPSFKGLRDDKSPREVVLEGSADGDAGADPDSPESLFDEVERTGEGALIVLVDGRRLRITNWDKVLYPKTGFTKGELIAYYARIAPAVLPHLHDRPLTLKRYPNGVEEQYFYEKQSPSHRPDWVRTVRIKEMDYTLAQDRPTLVWLANLADIELHTSLSLASSPNRPTMLVFDLDPGAPAGLVECCQVARVLHGLFGQLGLESFAKTSGSKGLQVYVPLNTDVSYEQTKPLAKRIAELLEQRMPELVVSRMTKRLRPGRVLVDWSQNDEHKTTVTVYSARARESATVSTPVRWDEV